MNAIKACNPEKHCTASASSAADPESGSKGGVLRTGGERSAARVLPAAEVAAVEAAATARAQGREEREARVRSVLGAATGKDGMRLSGFPPEQFDRVLLDPPCSALGLRPRIELVGRPRVPWGVVILPSPCLPYMARLTRLCVWLGWAGAGPQGGGAGAHAAGAGADAVVCGAPGAAGWHAGLLHVHDQPRRERAAGGARAGEAPLPLPRPAAAARGAAGQGGGRAER